MRVVRRTDTHLELRESPLLAAAIVGVFGVGGTGILLREGEALFAAGFVLLVLALAAAFVRATTCRFDRASGELSCARRSVLGTTHQRHALADMVAVHVERSAAQRSQAYRLVLATSTGARVPLTAHFTSGAAEHERTAQAIREFLGLAAPPPDVEPPGFGDLLRMARSGGTSALVDRNVDALRAHEERVRLAPDDVEARCALATALAMSGRAAEARTHLQHARDVAAGAGRHDVASGLDETIRRLDSAASHR